MDVTQNEPRQEYEDKSPWGLWETVVFSIAAIAIYFLVPLLIMRISSGFDPPTQKQYLQMGKDPFLLCISIIISSISALSVVIFFCKLRPQVRLKEYFGFNGIRFGKILLWVICFIFAIALVGWAVMDDGNRTSGAYNALWNYDNIPLLVLATVIISPVYEELLYRGFMFKGIESASGPALAVMLTSLLFALSHHQYDIYGIYLVFITGLFLGYARVKTDSIFPPIAMHSSINLLILMAH